MELFKDTTYEEMDEISQMIEPIESKINVELSQFPDEFILDDEFFNNTISYNRHRFYEDKVHSDLRKIVENKAYELGLTFLSNTARTNSTFMEDFFQLDIEEGSYYDAELNKFFGEVKVTKKKIGYEERDLEDQMKEFLTREFNSNFYTGGEVNKARINEILDLFNVSAGLAERKGLIKVRHLRNHYISLIQDRKLNIRDIELFKRFVGWNFRYIKDGSLPAFSNITKLKIMMRKGLPIYSIKEDVV